MAWTGPVFPSLPGITYPRKRIQNFSTVKQDAISGKRTRTPLWTYPIYGYELPISYLRSDSNNLEWQQLLGFVASVQGPAKLFGFSDSDDGSVTNQGFGEGDGVSTAFQLVRSLGGFTEPVFLVNGTPDIFVAGVLTAPASISAYGVVNFAAAPANGALLTWTGSYYWPCRFDDDALDLEKFLATVWECKSIKFTTEKL